MTLRESIDAALIERVVSGDIRNNAQTRRLEIKEWKSWRPLNRNHIETIRNRLTYTYGDSPSFRRIRETLELGLERRNPFIDSLTELTSWNGDINQPVEDWYPDWEGSWQTPLSHCFPKLKYPKGCDEEGKLWVERFIITAPIAKALNRLSGFYYVPYFVNKYEHSQRLSWSGMVWSYLTEMTKCLNKAERDSDILANYRFLTIPDKPKFTSRLWYFPAIGLTNGRQLDEVLYRQNELADEAPMPFLLGVVNSRKELKSLQAYKAFCLDISEDVDLWWDEDDENLATKVETYWEANGQQVWKDGVATVCHAYQTGGNDGLNDLYHGVHLRDN